MANQGSSTLLVSPYVPFHTLTGGHCDTVNALAFSPDGTYLASGGDDNALIIWSVSQHRLLYRVPLESAVDAIIWHPVHPETVIVGCQSGRLFQMHDFSLRGAVEHDIHLGARSTVHCLDFDTSTRFLAMGLGDEVHITREITKNTYRGDTKLPSPPERDGLDESQERRLRAVFVRFHKDGQQLIVSYLAHGIVCWSTAEQTRLWSVEMPLLTPCIGGTALSPNTHDIVVYNLVNGVSCYSMGSNRGSRMLYKLDRVPRSKHCLQVHFIHSGDAIVCGTTTGNVCVWNAVSGELFQLLAHDDDIVQAVSATMTPTACYIATATAGKGQSTYIKIWKAGIGARRKDTAPEISDVVADVVRAVTSNHLYQPKEGIRQGMTIAITVVVCFACVWALTATPWASFWERSLTIVRACGEIAQVVSCYLCEEIAKLSHHALVLILVMGQWASAACVVGWTWIVDGIRSAAREFLFPTNAALGAGNPALPGRELPGRVGEF